MLQQDFLAYYSRNNPDLPCVNFGGEVKSYAEIEALSNLFANGLLDLGIEKGDRVTVVGENSLEHVLMFYAAVKIGVIFVPFNYRLAAAELEYVVGDSGAKLLLALQGMEDTLRELRSLLPDDIILLGNGMAGCENWHERFEGLSNARPKANVDQHDACLQLYTSGTTGHPKGVVISQFNLVSLCHMNTIGSAHRACPGESTIVCAPLFHIAGIASIAIAVYSGQQILLHETFDPIRVLDDVEEKAVANVFMVPAMIAAVLQMPGIRERNYSTLKQISYGASPISETILREALDVFQCDFMQLYGMTETAGTVVALTPLDHRRALGGQPELLLSCGRPSVGASACVMDQNGEEKPRGEVGEIWLKSPTNMLGYHNLPEATAQSLTEGWVHTGDAGTMDEEGFLFLKDRIKDMVVSGAENIYPVEVENAIAKHAAVRDVAVIGVPDDKFGEALLAFVVLKPGATLELEELISFSREKIAGYKIPRQLEIIDELPRNPSGKILKKILREPYWQGKERAIS